ncbi:GDP-mannose 4,6-dehydratase [Paraburkholderia terrae]|uniref:UDP-glucose 4-epimerase n=1 Tax=Paraburkholderia terrae TaxID=311230 RepID=A0ABM7TKC6_9BURK|nr:GDP-mannose 4,6-dehydratase [Paraburkholderia terrae]BCZ78704.1 UDP-glucose 4-epimerase [Paraburkholderia terrae]BDC39235.1 UDP-glucose 4-epimerase [Paraburkholderia terrae]
MRRVLITGAHGFTGGYIRDDLVSAGYQVTGTCVGGLPREGELRLDITSLEDCRHVIETVRPDFIVHLAAISFVAHEVPLDMYRVNVLGTLNLLQACADVGHRPDKILIVSSANVYGNAGGVIDESIAPEPVNHYGASKSAMENLVKTWFDRLPIIVVRPFNYTGRGQAARFLIPKIVWHFVNRRPVIELGNLDVARDFSDVRTVAKLYRELLESDVGSEVVNICSGKPYTLEQVLETVSEASGHKLEVRVNPAFVRENEVKVLVGSTEKLRRLAPEVQPFDFSETIKWMVNSEDGRS